MKINLFLVFLGMSLIARTQPKITPTSLAGFSYRHHETLPVCVVEYIVTGTEAASTSLKIGDTIVAVGGKTFTGLKTEEVQALFRAGSPGPIQLTLRNRGVKRDLAVNRTLIPIWDSFRKEMDTVFRSAGSGFENFRKSAGGDDMVDMPFYSSYGKSAFLNKYNDVLYGNDYYEYVIDFGKYSSEDEVRKKQLELLNNIELLFTKNIIVGRERDGIIYRGIYTIHGHERGKTINEPFVKVYYSGSGNSYGLSMSIIGGRNISWFLLSVEENEKAKVNAAVTTAIKDLSHASKDDFTKIMGGETTETVNFFEEQVCHISTIQVPGFDTKIFQFNLMGNYMPRATAKFSAMNISEAVDKLELLRINCENALAGTQEFYGRYMMYDDINNRYEYHIKMTGKTGALVEKSLIIIYLTPDNPGTADTYYTVKLEVWPAE